MFADPDDPDVPDLKDPEDEVNLIHETLSCLYNNIIYKTLAWTVIDLTSGNNNISFVEWPDKEV